MTQKYTCNTCGRVFPEGQGVILEVGSDKLYFHSKACAYKFLKEIVIGSDTDCISSSLKKVKKKYEEILEAASKKAEKKI
ncbi:hypothetical protein V6M85_00700 [Sulfolobus tengchongensis]|uniref:TRASH domain-containing protein n=1 Tax=Sulfolobus tengchongensis TaxID=207809 RepID=A0AAX4L2P6_9CREN